MTKRIGLVEAHRAENTIGAVVHKNIPIWLVQVLFKNQNGGFNVYSNLGSTQPLPLAQKIFKIQIMHCATGKYSKIIDKKT